MLSLLFFLNFSYENNKRTALVDYPGDSQHRHFNFSTDLFKPL